MGCCNIVISVSQVLDKPEVAAFEKTINKAGNLCAYCDTPVVIMLVLNHCSWLSFSRCRQDVTVMVNAFTNLNASESMITKILK